MPAIGRINLTKLQADDISRMTAKLAARGDLSDTTVRYVFTVLRIALGEALRTKRVVRNVALEVRAPKAARRERTPMTLDQVATFLDRVQEDRLGVLYMTAVGLGLRQGELLGLRWADVNLEAGTLAVRHTRNSRTGALAEPKTERSRRSDRLRNGPTRSSVGGPPPAADGGMDGGTGRITDPRRTSRRGSFRAWIGW